jgi:hypothetical protein
MIEQHDTDGFTLSEYVMNKYGHELYIKTRYIGYNLTDAKKAFRKKCKDIIKNENNPVFLLRTILSPFIK